jgi:hypothetical protein
MKQTTKQFYKYAKVRKQYLFSFKIMMVIWAITSVLALLHIMLNNTPLRIATIVFALLLLGSVVNSYILCEKQDMLKEINVELFTNETSLQELAELIESINIKNGWTTPDNVWEDPYWIPAKMMLIVTECSEAEEEHRTDDIKKFAIEMADIFIRTVDMCVRLKIPIWEAVVKKLEINANRSYRHGGKRI